MGCKCGSKKCCKSNYCTNQLLSSLATAEGLPTALSVSATASNSSTTDSTTATTLTFNYAPVIDLSPGKSYALTFTLPSGTLPSTNLMGGYYKLNTAKIPITAFGYSTSIENSNVVLRLSGGYFNNVSAVNLGLLTATSVSTISNLYMLAPQSAVLYFNANP